QRVGVMYLGKLVELGTREQIYERPAHPYTKALLSAVPDPAKIGESAGRIRLIGDVPTPINPPSGCRFRTPCWKAQDIFATQQPPLRQNSSGSTAACPSPEEGVLIQQEIPAESVS